MRTLGRFALAVVLAGLGVALAAVVALPELRTFFTAGATKGVDKLDLQPLSQRSIAYARDGSVLQVLHAEVDRAPVALDRVPGHVIDAVLDIEDARFYHHGPVDLRSMARALVTNVQAGKVEEGGSTITQQLVKNSLLTPRQDLHRKLKEAALAVRLANQMSKREILERYLNTVYFGNGAYGVQAAAERYFGIDVTQLTPAQGALLAGLIRNPVGYDPFRFPDVSRQRRDVVVDRMVGLRHLDADEASRIKAEPLPARPPDLPDEHDDYFTTEVKQQLLNDDHDRFHLGATGQDRYRALFEGGLRIHTTLDPRMQALAEDKVRTILPDTQGRFTAALAAVDPTTGAVRAMVGGRDFVREKFNLATQKGRQTGSAFKVFTLMAALEDHHWPSDSIDGTSPCSIPNPGGTPNPWEPHNVEGEEGGTMSLIDATVHSVNCAYARLVKIVGPEKVERVAHRMGITNALNHDLTITLGVYDVTPLQMATAYGTLAADGERHDPYYIDRIEDRHGKTIFQAPLKGERAVSAELARAETQVLEQVVQRGTGRSAAVPGWNVAGKTGTAEGFGDAWFVGYTPKLATAVWMGNPDTNQDRMYDVGGIRVYGGTYPARIVGAFLKDALAGEAPVDFPPPSRSIYSGGQYLRAPGGLGPPSSGLPGNGSQSGSESASGANGANDSPPTPSLPPVAAVKPLNPPRLRIPPPATIDVRSRIPAPLPTPTLPPRPVITRPSRATTPPPPTARRRRF